MRRSRVAGAVLGLGMLTTSSAFAVASGPTAVERPAPGVEVRAAADIFLDLGPVKGEKRD